MASLRDDRVLVLDLAGRAASSLDGLDNLHRLRIRDFAEDDVLTVQPAGDNGGDEKLRSVGVGASIRHGQETRSGVLLGEVLIRELLAVDRLATSAIATGEVTALKHELRNDAMELGAAVAKAFLASAKGTEVLSGLRRDIVVEIEVDAAGLVFEFLGWARVGIQDRSLPGDIEEDFDRHVCW